MTTPTVDVHTRSRAASVDTSPTGVLPRICIFCLHVKSRNGEELGSSETTQAEKKIRDTAIQQNDTKLLNLIGNYAFGEGQDFCALEAKYHHSCRRNYYNKSRASKENQKEKTHISKKAFKLCTGTAPQRKNQKYFHTSEWTYIRLLDLKICASEIFYNRYKKHARESYF